MLSPTKSNLLQPLLEAPTYNHIHFTVSWGLKKITDLPKVNQLGHGELEAAAMMLRKGILFDVRVDVNSEKA